MDEPVRMDYEKEYYKMREIAKNKEEEFNCKVSELTHDLIKCEREIEILNAKLSVVEMIFKK